MSRTGARIPGRLFRVRLSGFPLAGRILCALGLLGILPGLCFAPLPAQAAFSIVINELQYHPASDRHGEEYIELYNAGAAAVDLSGWRFSDGITYTFPTGVMLPPGAYLVVGNDPAVVAATYGITGVLGPFASGRLANSGERIALEDAGGMPVAEVVYDDHAPWPEAPDGAGPSLELLNPAFDALSPCSWGSSLGVGSPGHRNDSYTAENIPPCITGAAHAPIFPTSTQPAQVTASVGDNQAVAAVTLHYRPQGATAYSTLPMADDGTGGDVIAGDGLYTAGVPPQPAGTYMAFMISAVDDEGATKVVPDGAPGGLSAETGLPVTVSYLYFVEDVPPSSTLPRYRLLLTDENRAELAARDLASNTLLDATFLYEDQCFYNVGLRYRGESSRDLLPHPYRIKFRDAQEFESRERINLIGDALGREALTLDLFQRAGLPAPDARFVSFYINGDHEGDYLDVENVDRDFLKAHFGEADDGNLYRGIDHANLGYLGADPDAYRPYYEKRTNLEADDYADIMALTYAVTHSPDAAFVTEMEALADMRQWVTWFAIQALLDNHEGGLWLGDGDDYFLYRNPADGRFVLISWDHDYTFLYPNHSIWEHNWLGPLSVRRILGDPIFARWYYQAFDMLARGPFSEAEMIPRIDALPSIPNIGDTAWLRSYVPARLVRLDYEIPDTTLSITTNGGQDFVTTEDTVTLEGSCSPLRDVAVNGDAEGVTYLTPTSWRYTTLLWARENGFTISDGEESCTLTVTREAFTGGVLSGDTVVQGSAIPYDISEDILVPAGVKLWIEPGATLHFRGGRTLRVAAGGRLVAEGTAAQPIVFTKGGSDYWGGILLDQTQEDNRLRHVVVEYTREVISSPRTHGLSAYGARVTVTDSTFRYTDRSVAIQTYPWGSLQSHITLLRTEVHDITSDGVHVSGGTAVIQGNQIHGIRYGAYPLEGLEVSDMVTPALVLENRIYDVSDDCIDMNQSSAVVERNEIHHCGDKGISIGDPSYTTLTNNLVYACLGVPDDPEKGFGIAIKDGAVASLMNNTLADNKVGLGLYEVQEGHSGRGAGQATVVNTILWGNEQAILLDLEHGAMITVTYSDVEGGWAGEGNFDLDPGFRAPAWGSYRLVEDSPCVDSATPVGAPDVDLHGVARPKGEGVDRGALEFFAYVETFLPLVLREAR